MTSEFICALLSGVVAAGFTVAAPPATDGMTAGTGVTTPGSVLMLAGGKVGGKAAGKGVAAG
jgi:hypothetical protein